MKRTQSLPRLALLAWLAACRVEAEPFSEMRGRLVPNSYGTTPSASLSLACPRDRPLDNTPCADTVATGSHCEYAGGPNGDVEYLDPKDSVHTLCASDGSPKARWITLSNEAAPPSACRARTVTTATCTEGVCDGYLRGACGCEASDAQRVREQCPVDARGCPPLRPHHGQACAGTPFCDYDGCGSGALMQCLGGVWQMAIAVCP